MAKSGTQWGVKQVRGGECVKITCQVAPRLLHSVIRKFITINTGFPTWLELVITSNWRSFWHGFASRGFVSDSWAFLLMVGSQFVFIPGPGRLDLTRIYMLRKCKWLCINRRCANPVISNLLWVSLLPLWGITSPLSRVHGWTGWAGHAWYHTNQSIQKNQSNNFLGGLSSGTTARSTEIVSWFPTNSQEKTSWTRNMGQSPTWGRPAPQVRLEIQFMGLLSSKVCNLRGQHP